jgi:hypothetical protein
MYVYIYILIFYFISNMSLSQHQAVQDAKAPFGQYIVQQLPDLISIGMYVYALLCVLTNESLYGCVCTSTNLHVLCLTIFFSLLFSSSLQVHWPRHLPTML